MKCRKISKDDHYPDWAPCRHSLEHFLFWTEQRQQAWKQDERDSTMEELLSWMN